MCSRRVGRARTYRLCLNYSGESVCNWAVPVRRPEPLLPVMPVDPGHPQPEPPRHLEAWARLEVAKRRLIYSLLCPNLPMVSKAEDPQRGLAFDFLADPDPDTPGAVPVRPGT